MITCLLVPEKSWYKTSTLKQRKYKYKLHKIIVKVLTETVSDYRNAFVSLSLQRLLKTAVTTVQSFHNILYWQLVWLNYFSNEQIQCNVFHLILQSETSQSGEVFGLYRATILKMKPEDSCYITPSFINSFGKKLHQLCVLMINEVLHSKRLCEAFYRSVNCKCIKNYGSYSHKSSYYVV